MAEGRYSSKAQEQHFQPWRVRILCESHDYGRYISYHVVLQNMLTHEIQELSPAQAPTKAEAKEWAKAHAEANDLPFDLQRDVVDWRDAALGPPLHCVGCGETEDDPHYWGTVKRGWDPQFLCEQCTASLAIGKAAQAERKIYILGRHAFPYGMGLGREWEIGTTPEHQFRRLIAVLAGSPLQDKVAYSDLSRETRRRGQEEITTLELGKFLCSPNAWVHRIDLTEAQAQAYKDLLILLADRFGAARIAGKKEGSSLVTRLAKGEIHPDDFSKARDLPD